MAMATKLVSTFAIFFILVLVISEIPETEAHDDECLKEYGGDVGFAFCGAAIFPTICHRRCQSDKGAKGGRCVAGDGPTNGKCLCDFCSDKPSEIPKIRAQDSQCLREYIDAPKSYCLAYIYPSLCYHRCRSEKSAKGGKCDDDLKCFCDFCSAKPYDKFLSNV